MSNIPNICKNCIGNIDLTEHDKQIITKLLEPYDVESIEELVHNSYNKGREDAMNEFMDELPYSALVRMSTLKRRAEELKEQNNDK